MFTLMVCYRAAIPVFTLKCVTELLCLYSPLICERGAVPMFTLTVCYRAAVPVFTFNV